MKTRLSVFGLSIAFVVAGLSLAFAGAGKVVINDVSYNDNGKLRIQLTAVNTSGATAKLTGFRAKIDGTGCHWNKTTAKEIADGQKLTVKAVTDCPWTDVAKADGCTLKMIKCDVPVTAEAWITTGAGENKTVGANKTETIERPVRIAPK